MVCCSSLARTRGAVPDSGPAVPLSAPISRRRSFSAAIKRKVARSFLARSKFKLTGHQTTRTSAQHPRFQLERKFIFLLTSVCTLSINLDKRINGYFSWVLLQRHIIPSLLGWWKDRPTNSAANRTDNSVSLLRQHRESLATPLDGK